MTDGWLFLLRWFHFLAGITWIGMLYYFNFVQVPFFAGAEAPVRTGMIAGGLVSRALWWFRWGAMLTFITGWLYLLHRLGQFGVQPFFATSYGWAIFIGGIIGSLMWFNVWFIIWPAQQVVMASAARVKEGGQAIPEAAARGARGGVTSRGMKIAMMIVFAIILVIVEGNAVVGPATPDKASAGKKLLSTVNGTLWAGFVLTAIFVIALKIIFG
ncbi:MAG: antitermination protein NusG [Candidatus Rokuibacteriota bacterium]|nr:MAG: antitermination protein NusG [Candidatus Rokubacteria bacterium]